MIKIIPGYPNYEVCSEGYIISKKTGKPLAAQQIPGKYHDAVKLFRDGKRFSTNVHVLVGRAFLSEYQEGQQIHHIDETLPYPERNAVDNLWCGDQQQNIKDSIKKGRQHLIRDSRGRFA